MDEGIRIRRICMKVGQRKKEEEGVYNGVESEEES